MPAGSARRARTAAALALLAAVVAAAAATASAKPTRSSFACGVEFWPLKTLSDPQNGLVRLRARATTIAAIDALPMPHPTPTARTTPFERQVWSTTAQVVRFRLEADSDIHLVLYSHGHYLIAEMPAPACLTSATRDRRAIVQARLAFTAHCGTPTDGWRYSGAVARISGVGFWDFPHGQSGHAPNYAELHPVTSFRPIAGCGTGG